MSIQVVCSGCGAGFQAKDEWAGKHTKCPKCGVAIVIGGGSVPNASAAPAAPSAIPPQSPTSAAAEPPPSSVLPSAEAKPTGHTAKPIAKAKRLAPQAPPPGQIPPGYPTQLLPHDPYAAAPPNYGAAPYAGQQPYYYPPPDTQPVYPPQQPFAQYPYPQQPAVPPHQGYPPQQPYPPPQQHAAPPPKAQHTAPTSPAADAEAALPQIEIHAVSVKPASKGKSETAAAARSAKPAATTGPGAAPTPKSTSSGASAKPGRNIKLIAGCSAGGIAAIVLGIVLFRGGDGAQDAAKNTISAAPVAAKPAKAVVKPGEEDLADVVARLKTGIVLITLRDSKGDTLGLGTGFLINKLGQVVTNHHVIKGGARATASFSNGLGTEVKSVLAVDEDRDLAIVQLDFTPDDAIPLELKSDALLREGTKVIAIGHPRGLDYSVSDGIISALRTTGELPEHAREFLKAPLDQQWIQTTAAISGGNSGGPLMLPDGRVIGINTWVAGGENLGFAGHVRHIVELRGKVNTATPESLLAYNTAHGGLERAIADDIDAFTVGYGAILEAAEAADWQPDSEDNRELILRAAAGTTFSRNNGLMTKELEEFSKRLAGRSWEFERHVRVLNSFSIAMLRENMAAVMLFGRVISVDPREKNRFRVQLAGRGYDLDVVENYDAKDAKRIGDEVLVMGVRPPNGLGAIQTIVSGLVVKVKYAAPPPEAVLRECADYIRHSRKLDELQQLIAAPERKFSQVRFSAVGEERFAYTVKLNRDGYGFDAVRIPASTGAPDDDMVWAFSTPPETVGDWGITSIDGIIPGGCSRWVEIDDYRPANLSLPSRNKTRLVHLTGDELRNSRRHLLWFQFTTDKPVELKVTGIYRRPFTSRPSSLELFDTFGFQAVGNVDTNQQQIRFSQRPIAGVTTDNEPTSPGESFVVAAAVTPSVPGTGAAPSTVPRAAPASSVSTSQPLSPRSTGPNSPPKLTLSTGTGAKLTVPVAMPALRSTLPAYRIQLQFSSSVSMGGRIPISIDPMSVVNGGESRNDVLLPRSNWPMAISVRQTLATVVLSLPSGYIFTLRSGVDSTAVPDDQQLAAADDLRLLQQRGATVLALTPPPSGAGPMELVRINSSTALSDQYQEPHMLFLEGTPIALADAERISALPCLPVVALRNTVVDDAVARKLFSINQLRAFIVQNVPIGDAAIVGASDSRFLQYLFLDYTKISNAGAQTALRMPLVTAVSLRGNAVDDRCLAAIPKDSKISTLDLSETNIDEQGFGRLTALKGLHALGLGRLRVGAAGLRELAKIKTLMRLNLNDVPLTREMVDELVKMQNLNVLMLHNSGLSDAEFKRLKDALPAASIMGK